MMKSFCSTIITVTCIIIKISFVNSVENMSAILSHAVVPDVVDISPTEAVLVSKVRCLQIFTNLFLELIYKSFFV